MPSAQSRPGSISKMTLAVCSGVTRKIVLIAIMTIAVTQPDTAMAQIGGHTAADGPFTLDNIEDLDTTASGVARAWIPDYIPGVITPLQAVPLTTSGLVLAADQSPIGALKYTMKSDYQYIDYSFGVPMPGIPGASTATSPGDISTFQKITFLARISTSLPNQSQEIILESYPGSAGVFPKIHWKFNLLPGPEFQRVTLDLRSPDFIQNQGTLTIEDLLRKTRYMSVYFFGGPAIATVTAHVDDIQFTGNSEVGNWTLY